MALKTFFRPFFHVFHIETTSISTLSVRKCSSKTPENDTLDYSQHPGYEHSLKLYDHRVSTEQIKNDEYQRHIAGELTKLNYKLQGYTPTPPQQDGFFSKFFGPKKKKKKSSAELAKKFSNSPMGAYLYGSVGCGKTMLMDMLYDTCHIEKKQRVHFHQFMLDVHQRIHEVKKMIPRQHNVRKLQPYDPIEPVAKEISEETWLLCFDEFQVTDIADAMILKRLFHKLWINGVVVICTSNRKPDDLYKNGLQRINFLPFIPMLKENCEVYNLDSGIDYRRQSMPSEGKIYFLTTEFDHKYEMDKAYEELVSKEKAEEGPRHLTVLNRNFTLPKTCGSIVDCTFSELCKQPLGAADYLEICKHFDTILIRDVPELTLEKKTEARRFITLMDTLYDHRMRVIMSAEHEPDGLFATGHVTEGDKHHQRVLIGDLDIKVGDENELASIFTGEEELFAFERIASRLTEMQTEEYWKLRGAIKRAREKSRRTKVKPSTETVPDVKQDTYTVSS